MITGYESAFPSGHMEGAQPGFGISNFVYLLAHTPVTWHDAQCKFNDCYKKNGSIEEIANFLAEMQIAAANALIHALNQPTNTTAP